MVLGCGVSEGLHCDVGFGIYEVLLVFLWILFVILDGHPGIEGREVHDSFTTASNLREIRKTTQGLNKQCNLN